MSAEGNPTCTTCDGKGYIIKSCIHRKETWEERCACQNKPYTPPTIAELENALEKMSVIAFEIAWTMRRPKTKKAFEKEYKQYTHIDEATRNKMWEDIKTVRNQYPEYTDPSEKTLKIGFVAGVRFMTNRLKQWLNPTLIEECDEEGNVMEHLDKLDMSEFIVRTLSYEEMEENRGFDT